MGRAQVKLGGKVVSSGKLATNGLTVEFVRRGIIAKAGDLAVTIYLADANRFTPGEDKAAKYTHLNIAFDGCVPGANVHGDPMFKINGTGSHFWLVEGILTPLLTLGNVAVMGKTFGRRATGHQWFEEFTISNGKVVLDVAASNGGRAQVKLGGKVVSSGKLATNGLTVE